MRKGGKAGLQKAPVWWEASRKLWSLKPGEGIKEGKKETVTDYIRLTERN